MIVGVGGQNLYKTETTAMTRMTTSQARKDFKSTLEKVARGARIILSSHNKPVAAVVPIEDLKLLRAIEDRFDARAAAEAKAEADRDGTTSWETIKADLNL
jgi:prevent-host-death family protein